MSILRTEAPCFNGHAPESDPSPDDRLWAAQAFADADFSHYPDECPELDEWAYYEPEEPCDSDPHDAFLGEAS